MKHIRETGAFLKVKSGIYMDLLQMWYAQPHRLYTI